jgi:predicted SprT family Zn-dependent metalloprotease
MDKKIITRLIQREAATIWDSLCEIYPNLTNFDCPEISLNGRLWRVAGLNDQHNNKIELGFKFFKHSKKYANNMIDVILPHEIIHQADFNLFGESEKICGHGKKWCEIMLNYGLDAEPFHTMEISRK